MTENKKSKHRYSTILLLILLAIGIIAVITAEAPTSDHINPLYLSETNGTPQIYNDNTTNKTYIDSYGTVYVTTNNMTEYQNLAAANITVNNCLQFVNSTQKICLENVP